MELVTENMFFSSIFYVIKTIFIICFILKIASMSKTCWILGKVVYMYYSRLHIQKGRGMHTYPKIKEAGGGCKEIFFLLRVQITSVKELNN